MKVILRNTSTNLYFLGPNMWTNDPCKALDFVLPDRAVISARRTGLADLELVVSFIGLSEDLRMPVKSFQEPLAVEEQC